MAELYSPLTLGCFRLLRVERVEPQICCKLEERDLNDVEGQYLALSYEWGKEDPNQAILINDTQFGIRPNLKAALRTLFIDVIDHLEQKYIWIDAICLNQKDDDEKAAQVPLMKDIYKNAKQVFGFLGPPADHSDKAIAFMRQTIVSFWEFMKGGERGIDNFELPGADETVWEGIRALLDRSYFKRLWIWQEAVLAKELYLVVNESFITWDNFYLFIDVVGDKGLQIQLQNKENLTSRKSVLFSLAMLQKHRVRFHADGYRGEPIPALLQLFRYREVTEPVDRIWGSMALWDTAFAELVHKHKREWIDYTDEGKAQYWKTYIFFAKEYMSVDPTLCFLSLASSVDKNKNIPSWCPNWNSIPAHNSFDSVSWFTAGFIDPAGRRSDITIIPGSNMIRIPGILADGIETVIDGAWSYTTETKQICSGAKKLLEWEKDCLKLSQDIYNSHGTIPSQYIRALVAECIGSRRINAIDNLIEDYVRFKQQLCSYERGQMTPLYKGADLKSTSEFATAVQNSCQGRKFFSTTNGRVGIGPPKIKADDIIVAFDSAGPLYVLRESKKKKGPENETVYKLLGDAYVCELMTKVEVERHKIDDHSWFLLK